MTNFNVFFKLKMDKVTDGEGGGAEITRDAFGYETKPEEKPPEDKKPEETPPSGYIADPDKKPEEKPPEEKPPEEKPPAPELAGYGEEPPKPVEKKVEDDKKPDDKKPEDADDVQIADKGILLDSEVDDIISFAKTHKLSQEVVDAMAEKRKADVTKLLEINATAEEDQKQANIKIRADWHKELKDDPSFGGANFGTNVKKVNRVIDEFMPNLKKQLTETKVMLPPYVMRDLSALGALLFKTETLVEGEPGEDKDKDEKTKGGKHDHLDYYNS